MINCGDINSGTVGEDITIILFFQLIKFYFKSQLITLISSYINESLKPSMDTKHEFSCNNMHIQYNTYVCIILCQNLVTLIL